MLFYQFVSTNSIYLFQFTAIQTTLLNIIIHYNQLQHNVIN